MSYKTSVKDILKETLDLMTRDMDVESNEYKDFVDFFNYEYNNIISRTEKKYMLKSEAIKCALDDYIFYGKEKHEFFNWEYKKTTEHYQVFKKQRKNKPFKYLEPIGM